MKKNTFISKLTIGTETFYRILDIIDDKLTNIRCLLEKEPGKYVYVVNAAGNQELQEYLTTINDVHLVAEDEAASVLAFLDGFKETMSLKFQVMMEMLENGGVASELVEVGGKYFSFVTSPEIPHIPRLYEVQGNGQERFNYYGKIQNELMVNFLTQTALENGVLSKDLSGWFIDEAHIIVFLPKGDDIYFMPFLLEPPKAVAEGETGNDAKGNIRLIPEVAGIFQKQGEEWLLNDFPPYNKKTNDLVKVAVRFLFDELQLHPK